MTEVTVINFSHPLTAEQLAQAEALLGAKVERVIDVRVQLNLQEPLAPQIKALVDSVGFTDEWQTRPIVVNLPGLAPAAALLVAEIHGRSGHFPTCLRLRPIEGSVPVCYEVGEILNLQAVRDAARASR